MHRLINNQSQSQISIISCQLKIWFSCLKGEEIGMLNANISFEDTVDPQGCNCGPDRYQSRAKSRDPFRTPMQACTLRMALSRKTYNLVSLMEGKTILKKTGQPRPLFLLFSSFHFLYNNNDEISSQQDSNTDRWSRRRGR